MIKWILLSAMLFLIKAPAVSAEKTVLSQNFNTMINDVSAEQMNTAHLFWSNERIKDYMRRKRALQNTKMMIAKATKTASDQNILVQKLSETEY